MFGPSGAGAEAAESVGTFRENQPTKGVLAIELTVLIVDDEGGGVEGVPMRLSEDDGDTYFLAISDSSGVARFSEVPVPIGSAVPATLSGDPDADYPRAQRRLMPKQLQLSVTIDSRLLGTFVEVTE